MTDDSFELTRRKTLLGLSGIGAGAALGGAGSMAFLNDEEKVKNNVVAAGNLDLKVDWTEHYNGEIIDEQELTDDPDPIFELGDVKPGDWGEATISLHVYDNPGYVHMATELTSNDGNGLNDPESEVDDSDGEDEGELADEILATMWYDGTEDDEEGGDNELEEGDVIVATGTLREVLDELNDGILLRNQVTNGADGVTAANSSGDSEVTATYCGEFQNGPGGQAQQCVQCLPTSCDDPEVVELDSDLSGFCYEPDSIPEDATHVTLKAAKGCYLAELSSDTETICLPDENPTNEQNQYGEISNATFYYCPSDGGNGDGGNGDDCWPNSTTQYVGLAWMLPAEVGNEVQGDSVTFDLKFYAQQCRHNPNPTNPYDS